MNQVKTKKIGNLFAIEISNIILREIKNPKIMFVTITGCDVTNDLSFAKVYFTCLKDEYKEQILDALNKSHKFIEMELSKRVDIRKMPLIKFIYDDSIEYGNKLEEKINEIEKLENREV